MASLQRRPTKPHETQAYKIAIIWHRCRSGHAVSIEASCMRTFLAFHVGCVCIFFNMVYHYVTIYGCAGESRYSDKLFTSQIYPNTNQKPVQQRRGDHNQRSFVIGYTRVICRTAAPLTRLQNEPCAQWIGWRRMEIIGKAVNGTASRD